MDDKFDLAIVGGGAAGLFAGARAASLGLRFCVIEKMKDCGLKLLASGSGQCNLTHAGDIRDFPNRYGGGARFVKPALFSLDNRALVAWFEDRGLPCEDRGDGKFFPVSRKSRDVRDLLIEEIRKGEGRIFWKSPVEQADFDGERFVLKLPGQKIASERLLICTGGLSYPGTGSTGDGYDIAEKFGHNLVSAEASLTPVFVNPFSLSGCAGISLFAGFDLYRNGKKQNGFRGDLLITHKGFSGPLILNNSRGILPGDELRVDWLPRVSAEDLEKEIVGLSAKAGRKTIASALGFTGLPASLLRMILSQCGIKEQDRLAQLSKKGRAAFVKSLKASAFIVGSKGGFNTAMATAGGVSLKEVNPKTMESRIRPGLYYAGEVLDVDGETGGFNLQFAFSSGALASESAAASLNRPKR